MALFILPSEIELGIRKVGTYEYLICGWVLIFMLSFVVLHLAFFASAEGQAKAISNFGRLLKDKLHVCSLTLLLVFFFASG